MNKKAFIIVLVIAVLVVAAYSLPNNREGKAEQTDIVDASLTEIRDCMDVNVSENISCKEKDLNGDNQVDIYDIRKKAMNISIGK